MEEEKFTALKLNNSMEKCGMKNRYQIITLLIIFCLYGTSEFLAIALPLMEINPYIFYFNKDLNTTINTQVNYDLCQNELKKYNYTIDYEKSRSSLVTDFEVFCSENKTGFIGSSLFFGVMIGSFISYFFSDRIGRKKTSLIFSFIYSTILLGFLLVKNLYLLYTLLFLAGLVYSIIILSSLLLLNEVLDVKLTAIFTTIIFNAYPVFGVLYSILFRDLDNWRAIFIIIGIIHLICVILLFFFVEESPRFYYVKNEIEKMENVLLKISTINNKDTNEIKKYLRGNEKDKDKDKVKVKDKVKDKNNNNFNLIDNENKSINEKSSFLNNNSYEVNLNIEERQNQNNLINDEIILNDGKKLIKN
jgi:MFS family permease